jgi:putative inorganic carbon (hco3(-)) transporter
MLVSIMGYGTLKIWQIKDPWLRKIMIAFLAEFVGICLMSYSNPTLGQFPTSTVLFIGCVLFTTGERWDKPADTTSPMIPDHLQPTRYETV